MTGISWRVDVDDADMRAKLVELIGRMERPEGFYGRVGEHLLNSVGDNFDNEQSPDGEKWSPLSSVTVDRRDGAEGPILRAGGALRGSLNAQVEAHSVRVGTNLPYGAIQHFGGESGGYMKGAVLPPRPYLGFAPGDEEEILAIAEEQFAIE